VDQHQPIGLSSKLLGTFEIRLPRKAILRSAKTLIGPRHSANQNRRERSDLVVIPSEHNEIPPQQSAIE
jgi:hypothetical protein